MSVFMSQGEEGVAALPQILAAADAINREIPSTDELNLAFTKLIQAGVLCFGQRYKIDASHHASIKRAMEAKGGLFTRGDKGLRWLRKQLLYKDEEVPVSEISEEDLLSAYEEYLNAFW